MDRIIGERPQSPGARADAGDVHQTDDLDTLTRVASARLPW
jgi:hypothetical protein